MAYKLSICIPTYNRAKCLPRLLDSIISQIDKKMPVEICISDNASEDDTKNLVEKYREKYSHIVYFSWPQNMGFNRNLLKVVELASGEYCWLMGSDDKLEIGAIEYAIEQLEKSYDLSGISVNHSGYDLDLKEQIYVKPAICGNLKNDALFTDAKKIFLILGIYFAYISAQIVKKSLWDLIVNNVDIVDCCNKYYGYIHLFIIWNIVKKYPKWFFIEKKYVGSRCYNDSYIDEFGYFNRVKLDIVVFPLLLNDVFGKDNFLYKKIMSMVSVGYVKHGILGAKLNKEKNFSWRALKLTISYYWNIHAFWIKIFPLFLLPSWLLLFVRWIYRKTYKRYLLTKSLKLAMGR